MQQKVAPKGALKPAQLRATDRPPLRGCDPYSDLSYSVTRTPWRDIHPPGAN